MTSSVTASSCPQQISQPCWESDHFLHLCHAFLPDSLSLPLVCFPTFPSFHVGFCVLSRKNPETLSTLGEQLRDINKKETNQDWESKGRSAICELKEVNISVTAISLFDFQYLTHSVQAYGKWGRRNLCKAFLKAEHFESNLLNSKHL